MHQSLQVRVELHALYCLNTTVLIKYTSPLMNCSNNLAVYQF